MQIEDVAGVGLTTGRTTQQKRHLTVCDSLLGEIVVDDERVLGIVTEELADGAARVRGEELEWRSVRGRCSHNDRVLHAVSLLEQAHDVGDGGSLLADSHVDAVERLGMVASLEDRLLVDDRVNSDGSFTSLSVTNDKLTLPSANRHQRVH